MGSRVVASVNTVLESSKTIPDSTLSLVLRAKEGEQEAFAELFDLHKKRVYSLCWRMTGDPAEAEDLYPGSFHAGFPEVGFLPGGSSFSTWLYRVAANTVLMQMRRRVPKQVPLDEPIEMESSFMSLDTERHDLKPTSSIDQIALSSAITELPQDCRQIFILHEVEGREHHEIAKLLRCSVGNSKSQLHKARIMLRNSLLRPEAFSPGRYSTVRGESKGTRTIRESGASLATLREAAS